jgi:hypothetical protein
MLKNEEIIRYNIKEERKKETVEKYDLHNSYFIHYESC